MFGRGRLGSTALGRKPGTSVPRIRHSQPAFISAGSVGYKPCYIYNLVTIEAPAQSCFIKAPSVSNYYRNAVQRDVPYLWWRMDEASGDAIDAMGNQDGPLHGNVVPDTSLIGTQPSSPSRRVSPASEYAGFVVPDGNATLESILQGSLTVEFWYEPHGPSGFQYVVSNNAFTIYYSQPYLVLTQYDGTYQANHYLNGDLKVPIYIGDGAHHVVVVRDAVTHKLKAWIDGVLVYDLPDYRLGFYGDPLADSSLMPVLYDFSNSSTIDEFQIYDYALSDDQVEAHNHFLDPMEASQPAFVSGPPPITSSHPAYVRAEPGISTDSQSCFINSCTYDELVLGHNPAAYWRLHETTGAFTDSTGHGWSSTATFGFNRGQTGIPGAPGNNAVYGDGIVNTWASFDDNVFDSSLDWTMEIWIKPEVNPNVSYTGMVFYKYGGSGTWRVVSIDKFGSRVSREIGASTVTASGRPLFLNNWHHLVMTYDTDTNTVTFYQDGVQAAQVVGWGNEWQTTNGEIYVGDYPFKGFYDEAAIYQRTLSSEEVEAHFNLGMAIRGAVRPSKPAFLNAAAQVTGSKPCFIKCIDSFTISKPAYMFGHYAVRDGQSAYIQIETPVTPSKPCYIQIETPVNLTKHCYINGAGQVSDAQPAFVQGRSSTADAQFCYIVQPSPVTGNKTCYIGGHYPNVVDSNLCYVWSLGVATVSKVCYLNGTHFGEIDNTRRAYINGRPTVTFERSTLATFINGVIRTITTNKLCYIYSRGLIGDWRLDDGMIDTGTIVADDHSSVDHDGVIVNFPSYVDGPYQEYCDHG